MVRSGILSSKQPRHRPKVAISGNLDLSDLTVHGVYFESMVGILTNRIKGWNFFSVKIGSKLGSNSAKKPASLPCFSLFLLSLSLSLSLSLHRSSLQATLPPARLPLAPPQVATPTTVRPPGTTAAPSLSLSPADLFHLSSFSITATLITTVASTTLFPVACILTSSSRGDDSFLNHSNRKQPLAPTTIAAAPATRAATTPAAQLSTVATVCTTSSSLVRPPACQVAFIFFFTLFTASTVDMNYNSYPLFMQWTLGRVISGPTQHSGSGPAGPKN